MNKDFLLVDLGGQSFHPIELMDPDRLNLFVFYNTDCLGCTGRALPFAYELKEQFTFINLIVVHVQFGNRKYSNKDVKSVYTNQIPPFPIYRDEGNRLFEYWKCEGTPHWIFIKGKQDTPQYSIFGSQEGSKMKLDLAISEMSREFS